MRKNMINVTSTFPVRIENEFLCCMNYQRKFDFKGHYLFMTDSDSYFQENHHTACMRAVRQTRKFLHD